MTLLKHCLITLLCVNISASIRAAELPSIDDPALKACIDRSAGPDSLTQTMILSSFDDSGLIERSVASVYVRRFDDGKSRAVIRLSEPPSRQGLAVLMVEKEGTDPAMFLYVPDLKRTRKVTGKQLASSMMGTDFSYEEFSHFQRSAATIANKRIDDSELDGIAVYVLETVPGTDDSPYARILSYIDKSACAPLKTEFLSSDNQLLKELIASRDSIKAVNDRQVPHEFVMYDRVKNTRTELSIENLVLDAELNENIFSPKRLGTAP